MARYKAVCAVDFVESWKFYDTFATRDAEGYSIGVPVFPWFVNEGEARSRRDVLEGRNAVRVKSCWGGMVAFDGRYFWGRGGEREEGMSADGGYFHSKILNFCCAFGERRWRWRMQMRCLCTPSIQKKWSFASAYFPIFTSIQAFYGPFVLAPTYQSICAWNRAWRGRWRM